ncbi:PLC-like phosphodiesterase [Polychytrium aggregatum]|uniref:PLC-like phosphodiesterase n=1 Tax=Polychytrium aggregatum TaxID=110093 RepID=UPI0022FF2F52|nr:PLC-like phosphodiesterase [Polychytrium aggregatum]KAI9204112.1 PLC-like phosphodiesterase [Polychytrium aggregatum]
MPIEPSLDHPVDCRTLPAAHAVMMTSPARDEYPAGDILGPGDRSAALRDASSLKSLTEGTRMMKYPNKLKSKPEERMIKLDLMPLQISWESKKKKLQLSTVDLHSIREIRLGQNTKAFELRGKRPEFEERAFSIIYVAPSGEYKMLNLVAPSKELCSCWVSGLHMLQAQTDLSEGDPAMIHTNIALWLGKIWKEIDIKNQQKLNLDEVMSLMKRLNIYLSKSELKSIFKNADIRKEGYIDFSVFSRLYQVLRFRPEIAELFASLSKECPYGITLSEFQKFVLEIQHCLWSEEQCLDYFEKYTPEPILSNGQRLMDLNHFTTFLMSANNSIFKKPHMSVYQDMSLPLNDYFINTSHNTYLLGDQFAGESSVEGYIRALQSGCRCVELDCWDGPNGAPLVYHGRTLTTRILFKDAIEAIAKYAFRFSPYPLVLSIENHCGLEQQRVMALIMNESFGSTLLPAMAGDECERLPSPMDLTGRVLVKCKITQITEDAIEGTDDDDGGGGSGEVEPGALSTSPLSDALPMSPSRRPSILRKISLGSIPSYGNLPPPPPLPPPSVEDALSAHRSGDHERPQDDSVFSDFAARPRRTASGGDEMTVTKRKSSPKLWKKVILAKELERITFCKKVGFSSFSHAQAVMRCDYVCSFSERRSLALVNKQRAEYIEHNKQFITRVYPSAIRVTSSNHDPMPHWACGCSMVALNFQTLDRALQLNTALFLGNGRCGYVLKPEALRRPPAEAESGRARSSPGPGLWTIRVISAQQLPKPKGDIPDLVIDPFVEVEVIGGDHLTLKHRTSRIARNGFNPFWNEKFQFYIDDPAMVFLKYQVVHGDAKLSTDLVGSYVIHLPNHALGYRHVPLYDWKGELVPFSTLFVRVAFESAPANPSQAP